MVVAHKEVEHMLAAPGIVLVVVRIVGHKEAEAYAAVPVVVQMLCLFLNRL